MLILLMYFPGGLVQVGYAARDSLLGWLDRRMGQPRRRRATSCRCPWPSIGRHAPPAPGPALRTDGAHRPLRRPARRRRRVARGRSRRDRRADRHERCGKSSLMNAIGGFVSCRRARRAARRRRVRADRRRGVLGSASAGRSRRRRCSRNSPSVKRSRSRWKARGRIGMLATALAWPPTVRRQRRHRAAASELVDFLGLGRYADHYIADLSTGTRRIVELAALARARGAGAVSRRADRRCRPEGDRGVRSVDRRDPQGTGRVDAHHRARHAAHHGHQRPGVLPGGRRGHRRRRPDHRSQRSAGDRELPRHRRTGDRPQRCRRGAGSRQREPHASQTGAS